MKYIGIWEKVNNPDFNYGEFATIRNNAGLNNFKISVKEFVERTGASQPERIDELKAQYDCIGNPYNESPKHWIGLDPHTAPDELLRDLTRNSYEIVKTKYSKKK